MKEIRTIEDQRIETENGDSTEKQEKTFFNRRNKIAVLISIFCLLILLLLILGVWIYSQSTASIETTPFNTHNSTIYNTTSYNGDTSNQLQIVHRNEWNAMESRQESPSRTQPAEKIIVSHSAGDFCKTEHACAELMRLIQVQDMKNGNDIANNFYIGGDGTIYEGCGFSKIGSFLKKHNSISLGIQFIGNYDIEPTTAQQMNNFTKLVEAAVEKGYAAENYKILLTTQLQHTESPGRLLQLEIQKNNRWTEDLS